MRELVGTCLVCGKDIYCEYGFFNGVVLENGKTVCFSYDEAKNPF